jgi:hypothetical protein
MSKKTTGSIKPKCLGPSITFSSHVSSMLHMLGGEFPIVRRRAMI